jgi:hypothetical protein
MPNQHFFLEKLKMENPKHKSLVGFFNSLDFEIQFIRNHQICISCYSR